MLCAAWPYFHYAFMLAVLVSCLHYPALKGTVRHFTYNSTWTQSRNVSPIHLSEQPVETVVLTKPLWQSVQETISYHCGPLSWFTVDVMEYQGEVVVKQVFQYFLHLLLCWDIAIQWPLGRQSSATVSRTQGSSGQQWNTVLHGWGSAGANIVLGL